VRGSENLAETVAGTRRLHARENSLIESAIRVLHLGLPLAVQIPMTPVRIGANLRLRRTHCQLPAHSWLAQVILTKVSCEPTLPSQEVSQVAVPVEQVARILGLKRSVRSMAAMASAVESGLPKQSLARVAERAGFVGTARNELIHRVIPPATYKRRKRLKLTESEKTERLARVIALAELLWGEPAEAQRFLRTPHPELGRKRPIEAALTELGARQVEDVVMRALLGLPA